MAFDEIFTGFYLDPNLEDGYVRQQEDRPGYPILAVYMNARTHTALATTDGGYPLVRLFDILETMPEGTYLIPRAALEPDMAADLQNAVAITEPGGEGCTMPGCMQDQVSVERGYPLCQMHSGLLDDWDSLVA